MRAESMARPLGLPVIIRLVAFGTMLLLVGVPVTPVLAVSTFTVTTTADNGSDAAPTAGSLRKAIIDADNNAGADIIEFAIGAVGSQQTIQPPAPLPLVTGQTLIDGWSQGGPGYTGPPLIEIDGVSAAGAAGIWVLGANSTVRGLAINGFGDAGIILDSSATNAIVVGNYLGTRLNGTTAHANQIGISVVASDVTIGGTTATDRNIIAGNLNRGVNIVSGTQIQIIGNYIGTDVAGTVALGNQDGFDVSGGSNITIGGTTSGAGNLISGNTANGVFVHGATTTGVLVQGNRIGTNPAGTAALANGSNGVRVSGGSDVTIGGTASGASNVISGNAGDGVVVSGATTTGVTIQQNIIGLNAAGTAALANTGNGVNINGAPNATIGGTSTAARNVISGHSTTTGVLLQGSATTGAKVQGNSIGTNAAGSAAIGNYQGVFVSGAPDVTIGGTAAGAGNLISGNVNGVLVNGAGATGAIIQGNVIGLNAAGTATLGNGNGVNIDAAPSAMIGGTASGAGNLVSGNVVRGILVQHAGSSHATVQGNRVGTDAAGTTGMPNASDGILIDSASNATVGGTSAGTGNVIAFNGAAGIAVTGTATANALRGNSIFSNTGLGIDLGSAGVTANDAGDGDSGANNLQNFPVLTSASVGAGTTRAVGTLNSTPGTTFQLDFYANASCDPSGNGEGRAYLGSTSVMTNGSGDVSFNATTLAAATPGQVISATATDPSNNTSEFSACRALSPLGVTVTPGSVSVAEGGATSAFTVSLATVPANAVALTLTFDASQITVSPSTLTFQADTSALTAQTVTVAAVDDAVAEAPLSRQVTFSAASADSAYAGIAVSPVTVNVADNDAAGVTVVQSGGTTAVAEGGATDSFTMVLTSQPTADVTVTMAPGTQVTTTPAPSLTFTSVTWNVPQTVTVAAVDDTVAQGPHTGSIAFTVTSGDANYNGLAVPSIAVAIADNDTAGIVVSPTSGLVTTEAGGTAAFTVRLSTVPTGPVTIPVRSSDTTEGTVSPGSLTFQPNASALTPQTVTVTGVDDQQTDGDIVYTIVLGAATSTDPAYSGADPADPTVTNRDDDRSGSVAFTAAAVQVSENAGQVMLTVERAGASGSSRTAALATSGGATVRPEVLVPVSVSYATANGTATAGQDYTAVAGTLTFGVNETTTTIVVPILSDSEVEGPETFTIALSSPTGGATLGAPATVTVTIVDTTPPPPPPSPQVKQDEDDTDKRHKTTEEQRQQHQLTNSGNRDDVYTEGNVVEAHQDEQPAYVVIANKDGLVRVNLLCGSQCPTIRVGDYLEADGEKQNEALFDATDVTVKHPG